MKTKIFYFSGTGNSLAVARLIAAGLGEGCELVPVVRALARREMSAFGETDCMGLVFPVYMCGPPLILSRFIDSLALPSGGGGPYIFAVATSGGGTMGALSIVNRRLRRSGRGGLDAGWSITMPGNYTPLYGAWPEEKQERFFAAGEKLVADGIVPCVNARRKRRFPRGFWPLSLISTLFYRVSSPRIPDMARNFSVTAKCDACGLCAGVCPTANIEPDENGRPVWKDDCQQCMACLQWCPKEAIELGSRTAGRKRYRHPKVRAADIAAQRA